MTVVATVRRVFERLKRQLAGSLRKKLILGVVAINALIMTLFVVDLTARQQKLLLSRQTEQALALAQSVATSTAGWLAARDFRGLQEIVRSLTRYPDLRYAMLLDMQGHIVAHSDPAMIDRYVRDLPALGDNGGKFAAFVQGRSDMLIDAYCPVVLAERQIGWVRVGLGQERLNARLGQIRREGTFYALAAVLVGSLIAAALGAWVTRRFKTIQRVADAIHAGDRSQRAQVNGSDEAATLASAFNSMLDALAAREQALGESEARYRELFQGIHAAVVVHGPNGVILEYNTEAMALLGLEADQMLGRSSIDPAWHLVDADGRRLRVDEFPANRVRADGQPLHNLVMGIERPQQRDTVWALVNADPVWDARGKLAQVRVVFTEITEKKRIEDELRDYRQHLEDMVASRTAELAHARDQADFANRAKSVFLANMSHELRTPLNAVLGFAQIMARDAKLASEHQHELEVIDRSGRHLLSLINDVLEISRIEAGRTSIQNETFDLTATIDAVEEMIRVRADAKGLALRIDAPADLPRYVHGDAPHLRQVLINLLGNAVKFTERGEVGLRLRRDDGDSIRFDVTDTGPGIPEEETELVFRAFHQTAVGAAKSEGTGLGLTISRSYVHLMGGELTLASTLGRGSTFSFTLPLPAAEAPPALVPEGVVVGLAEGQAAPRILVVEDHADSRALLVTLLRQAGFQVADAANGGEAVETYSRWHPDLIWMDMRMPVMDGYEATRRIRALPGGQSVKIAALTASAFQEDRGEITAAGCDEVLSKPVDDRHLFAVMQELLGVRYRYADSADGAAGEVGDVDLSGLNPELRAGLRAAAQALDVEATSVFVDRIRGLDAALAEQMATLVKRYRFDRIVALCEAAGITADRAATTPPSTVPGPPA